MNRIVALAISQPTEWRSLAYFSFLKRIGRWFGRKYERSIQLQFNVQVRIHAERRNPS